MGKVSTSTLWTNLIVISVTWGSSFVFVKPITESMYPFAFAASRGFIDMAALLAWLASRRRALLAYGSGFLPRLWKTMGHMGVLGTTNGLPTNVPTMSTVPWWRCCRRRFR
jgi:drug/metabolite transporter (DMT)-like permease